MILKTLYDNLEESEKSNILLGVNAEVIRSRYILKYQFNEKYFYIQITTENNFKPVCILNSNNILIGFNKEVCIINQKECNLIKRIALESQFTDIKILSNSTILIVFETGILCLDSNYNEIWNFYKDVLQDFNINEKLNIIHLYFMDSGSFEVDLISGKAVLQT